MVYDKFYTLENQLEDIDKKFYANIEKFVSNNSDNVDIMDRIKIFKTGRDVICEYIIERYNLLIRSNAIHIPDFKNEHDINRWFKENCNNIGLEIFTHHKRHSRFNITGCGDYGGIDYICKISDGFGFQSCVNNYYSPHLNLFMNDNQKKIYDKFCEIVEADFLPIELEYLSGNFIKHKHPDIVSMVICFKKDKDISTPVLELKNTEAYI